MTTANPEVAPIFSARFWRTAELRAAGWTKVQLRAMIDVGRLTRVRRGRYAPGDLPAPLLDAARLGGRVDCVTLLALLDVFVGSFAAMHVQFDNGASRLPRRPLETVPHWRATTRPLHTLAADIIEALAQAVRCQAPRDAVATLDSAWHLGLVDEADIGEIFARLPLRYRALRGLLDSRSESGPETLVRLLLRALGCHVDVQVHIPTVGRVDLLIDGWLIVECDSRAHHEGWDAQRRDRRRDLAAAALGYTTVRPVAEDILYRYEDVLTAMKAVIATRDASGFSELLKTASSGGRNRPNRRRKRRD
ncbi:type IV toxin-antitoxin system AbiEi family antitoxin domain-containing protein [Microbacterium lushaniae]|uniref:Type IV toxin-antitoxin system AbiEi family antitoxin domain-containing protein n=1 Tax=Microbacterium lushaniae TaxID=2614639 RepID=A0A5J6L1L8_9MICO|nr:type IV toxin-antitoxin system AbiEi family antitoxin domain-containing protein [Microbacterium lushaniae]QEW02423.1 type IV toxin-antitoxin system AbiEi family antitoxin domain-containing protein [Microbacterium lushaniae]